MLQNDVDQDDQINDPTDTSQLDQWAKINIAMDKIAKRRRRREEKQQTRIHPGEIDGELWPIYINDTKIVANTRDKILEHCRRRRSQRYWSTRHSRHQPGIIQPPIARRSLAQATKSLHPAARIWKLKHATGRCAVAQRMKLRGQWPSDLCIKCGELESTSHVWTCRHRRRDWKTSSDKLRAYLLREYTDRDLQRAFLSTLQSLLADERPTTDDFNPKLRRAINAQYKIGLDRTMVGEISTHWGRYQTKSYRRKGSWKSGAKWTRGLIRTLIQEGHRLWKCRNDDVTKGRKKDETEEHRLNMMIADQHNQGMDGAPSHRCTLLQRPLPYLLSMPTHDKREWLQSVIITREYTGRSQGHSSKDRTYQRILRRWIRQGRKFRMHVYQRTMHRTTDDLRVAATHQNWQPQQDDGHWDDLQHRLHREGDLLQLRDEDRSKQPRKRRRRSTTGDPHPDRTKRRKPRRTQPSTTRKRKRGTDLESDPPLNTLFHYFPK